MTEKCQHDDLKKLLGDEDQKRKIFAPTMSFISEKGWEILESISKNPLNQR